MSENKAQPIHKRYCPICRKDVIIDDFKNDFVQCPSCRHIMSRWITINAANSYFHPAKIIKSKPKWKIRLEFKLQDMWIGCYWENKVIHPMIDEQDTNHKFDIWIILIPCVPLHITREYTIRYRD